MSSRALICVFAAMMVAACRVRPPPSACSDFRMMTFYSDHGLPVDNFSWDKNPEVTAVCVVAETKIEAPK